MAPLNPQENARGVPLDPWHWQSRSWKTAQPAESGAVYMASPWTPTFRHHSQPRLTIVRREWRSSGSRLPAECGIAGARRIVGTGGRRWLLRTSTRWAERQRM